MEEPIYQLPYFCYFIDSFLEEDILKPKIFLLGFDQELVMPFGSDNEEDLYFDISQNYFTVVEENITDFLISEHFLGTKHMGNLGDVVGGVYRMELGEEANNLYEEYYKEYRKSYNKEYIEGVIKQNLGTNQSEYNQLLSVINERLGSRPAINIKDLSVFMPSLSFEMQYRSQRFMEYFNDYWSDYYSQNKKKKFDYKAPDELNKLLEILEPFDSC